MNKKELKHLTDRVSILEAQRRNDGISVPSRELQKLRYESKKRGEYLWGAAIGEYTIGEYKLIDLKEALEIVLRYFDLEFTWDKPTEESKAVTLKKKVR